MRVNKGDLMSTRRVVGFLLISILLAIPALAQNKKTMSVIDLLNVPNLTAAQLSPDGNQIVFVLAKPDWKLGKRVSHVWRVSSDGTGMVQMTNGTEGEQEPRWSPDGMQIAFVAKRGDDKNEQVYLLPSQGGEARRLTAHETAVSNIAWSRDGASIYFVAADVKSKEEKDKDEAKDDVFAFDENFKQRHLWTVRADNAAEKRLTSGDSSILQYSVSRSGKKIAFQRATSPLIDDSDEGEVWIMDSDGSNALQLTRNSLAEAGATVSPDDTSVLYVSNTNEKLESYFNGKLFVVPAAGGSPKLLLGQMKYEVERADWNVDGKSIYFTANMGVRSHLFRVQIATNQMEQITEGDSAIRSWQFESKSRRHLVGLDQPTNAGDIWIADEANPRLRKVTNVFDYLARDFELPRVEAVQWKGADGVMVEGLLTYPIGYTPGRRYPLIVNPHGGPAASDKFGFGGWGAYRPVLAATGYAVLQPNYRGSTGYGDDFLRNMVGHYFDQAHLDVVTGVDYLIARGIADGDKLAKMGWSGGGHMTNKIITFTDRFKAASSGAGAANWISMYAQSDVRIYRTPWFGGTPWQRDAPIDAYWNHSPLKDVAKVKTPTIFLVGERDVRVPSPQSVEMYRALKSNGVPTHLYIAPREPHGWTELRHQLFKINVELDWFEKYVNGRTYKWATVEGAQARGSN
jgi:dipeptidyl aminopeptidase/acylaminoacyl peptidase